ncbi:MAG: hypothetical protein ACAH59_08680 [Pseudobdellovibrionaceae bacterium]
MKHTLILWALAAVVPVAVLAQQPSLDEEVNAELDRMYQTTPSGSRRAQKAPSVQVNVQAQPQVSAAQNTYQASTQMPTQTQVQTAPVVLQKQPTTYVEATPLVESGAEKLRKSRQDAELNTEQKIVEKLEQSRLEDEKNRAEVLFGDKFNSLANKNQQPQPAPLMPVVVPEQVVQPAPVVVQKEEDKLDREAIRGEVTAALAELKTTQTPEEKPAKKSYFSVMAGSGEYPDARNVKGQYSLGVAFGKYFTDRVVGELSLNYSNYQVEQMPAPGNGGCVANGYGGCEYYPRITDMNQYGTAGLVKYQMLAGSIRPEVGGLMSYTYRTFTDKQFGLSDATVSSQALDAGLMLGASLELSEDFALGLDYRYMWNMTNKVNGTTLQKSSIYQNQTKYTPIEEMNYYNFSVVGRATF